MSPVQNQQLYRQAVGELLDRLVAKVGDDLEVVLLYGSVARGDATPESDIDVMIISRKKEAVYEQAADIRYHNDLKYETLTTLIVTSPEQFEEQLAWGDPFLAEVLREGEAIYGRERFEDYQRAFQVG